MKKGFTLLEMLAVIVVMSILSLIILPNITGQLADKKEEISKVSQKIILSAAELYANETGNTYQTITINDLVEAGKLEQPIIDQKTGKEISLTKEISIDASGNACIVGIDDCDRITYKQYKNGEIVYFNPVKGKKCNKEDAKSTTGTKSGCMKWYAFNDSSDETKVNLLLDHNTTTHVPWSNQGSDSKVYSIPEMVALNKALKSDTASWKKELEPRIISAYEISKITKNSSFNSKNYGVTYFDSNTDKKTVTTKCGSKYAWLFDNLNSCSSSGCCIEDNQKYQFTYLFYYGTEPESRNDENVMNGYWTSTEQCYDGVTECFNAFSVDSGGAIFSAAKQFPNYGIRPVITVSKSKLS